MESSGQLAGMESSSYTTPDSARAALRELTTVRGRIADRITSPWWYRVGVSLSTTCLFLGMGLVLGRPDPGSGAEAASSLLIASGACVAPIALLWALKRSTGVSIDRYSQGMAGWCIVMFSLLAVAFVLQQFVGVPFALAAAGVVAFVVTYDRERRIDAPLRERVRAGG